MSLDAVAVGQFAAIYVPNFILQAIARNEPELRAQPLVVIDGPPPTYQVIALNRIAERLGVARGMTKAAAGQFAQVVIRQRCLTFEKAAHAALLDVAWSITPRVEDFAADTLLLDLSGLDSLFGDTQTIAQKLVERIATLGLAVHIAVSANVETARIVARALSGLTTVPPGEERRFLETLPVGMLSPSEELAGVFDRWGIVSCKQLASLSVLSLSECTGQEGVRLNAIAGGQGMRPLLLAEPVQHFEEWFELDEPVDDLEALSFILGRLLDQLTARLTARSLSVAAIHTQFELQPSFDNAFDTTRDLLRIKPSPQVFLCTLEMPVPTRDSKLLLKLLRLRLQSSPPSAPIQKIQMTAQSSLARVTQGSLFVPAAPDPDKLELTIARIAAVVGQGNVGSPQLADSHRPGALHMRPFSALANTSEPSRETLKQTLQTAAQLDGSSVVALRLFRPPLPARVQLQNGRPAKVCFQAHTGKVLHASGPWRTAGEWWEEKPWQHDDWDLEIHFSSDSTVTQALSGFYRLFYDHLQKKWFVRGVYD